LAQYAVGLWKQSKGDPSGLEDLARIDKSLADMADKAYGRVKDTVVNANDVALKGNQMRNANQRTANDGARLGLARAAQDRPDFAQMTNDKGEAVFVDRRKIKSDSSGVAVMPAGIRPQKLPQTLSDQQKMGLEAYYAAVKNAPPQTQAEGDQLKALYGVQGLMGAPSGGMPGWGEKTVNKPTQASGTSDRASPQQDPLQPTSQAEYRVLQTALQQGLTPVGRGNSVFGTGELLFADRQGNKLWASQLGQ